jgi:TfoX/Sxy family transcriptional regulator of competence genes
MAYNEKLAARIRLALKGKRKVVEKKMFGGVAFMLNDKMCVGINNDDLMIRCDPDQTDELLAKKGVRLFDLTGKPMKGWLLVNADAVKSQKDFEWWISLAADANKKIKR